MGLKERSHGAVLLSRSPMAQADIAIQLDVAQSTVSYWSNGQMSPLAAKREIMVTMLGIPIEAWDRPPPKYSAPPGLPLGGGEGGAAPRTATEGLEALEAHAYALIERLRSDPSITLVEHARLTESCARTLTIIQKNNGRYDLGVRLLHLPIWKEIRAALERGLRGHPEAARAVEAELKTIEAKLESPNS